jgi:CO/xanthine dehydrogenase FAD-binding subunit
MTGKAPPNAGFLTPGTLPDLIDALGHMTADSRFIAGGTDLVRQMNEGSCAPDLIVDLAGIGELRRVSEEGGRLRVGATATFTEIQVSSSVRRSATCLAEAARQVGSQQIRNIATIGGNVANASPCGDALPALLVLGAEASLIDAGGTTSRRLLEDVLVGAGQTSLRHDEVITHLTFPALHADERSAFVKIGSRSTVSVARLSMAIVVTYDALRTRVSRARIALGAVGETAFRDEVLEQYLEDRPADGVTVAGLARECSAAIGRSIPGRYSLPYKESAARALAYDVWIGLGLSTA